MSLLLGAIGAIVTAAINVSKALAVAGLAIDTLKVIGSAIVGIAKALGIVKPEREIEELGDRAIQAEEQGMKPEDYDSYEEWVNAIERGDWGYDPEKNKDIPIEDKIYKGVEVATATIIEQFPQLPIQDFVTLSAEKPDFFTVERFNEIAKIAVSDKKAFGDIINYVTGIEKSHDGIDRATDILMSIEKNVDKNLDDNNAYTKVASYYPRQNK